MFCLPINLILQGLIHHTILVFSKLHLPKSKKVHYVVFDSWATNTQNKEINTFKVKTDNKCIFMKNCVMSLRKFIHQKNTRNTYCQNGGLLIFYFGLRNILTFTKTNKSSTRSYKNCYMFIKTLHTIPMTNEPIKNLSLIHI